MSEVQRIDWMLNKLMTNLAAAEWAVVASTDGLTLHHSAGIDRDDADQISALASAIAGITKGMTGHFQRGEVLQTVVEMETGYVVLTAAGRNTLLAVMAGRGVELGSLGYEMNRFAEAITEPLSTTPRL